MHVIPKGTAPVAVIKSDSVFKRGDVVRLKSDGPPMTIEEASINGTFRVVWFSEWDDEVRRDAFHWEMLDRHPEDAAAPTETTEG